MKKIKYISIFVLIIFFINLVEPVVLAIDNKIEIKNKTEIENNTNISKNEQEIKENKSNTTTTESKKESQQTDNIENKVDTSLNDKTKDKKEIKNETTEEKENAENIKIEQPEQIANSIKGERTIRDGIYKIRSNINSNMYLDIDGGKKNDGANLQIWQKSNVEQQKFQVTYNEQGYYTITALHSGKVLDVCDAGKNNGANVWQYKNNDTEAQQWIIQEVESTKRTRGKEV